MKSFLSIAILFFLTVTTVFSQILEEREKEIASKNHIKTKTQFNHKYDNGSPSALGLMNSITSYSASGDVLEKNYYNNKGVVIGWEKYEYDANGNRTLYERENTSSTYKKQSKYDEENDVMLEAGFNGAENFRNEYSYIAANKPSEIVYSASNRVEQKLIYKHSGNSADLGIYAGGKTLTSKVIIKYDENRNILEETTLSLDDKELEKKTYTYNSSLLRTEEKTVQGNFNYRITSKYNANGKLITVLEKKASQEEFEKKVFTYDASGNLVTYNWRRNAKEKFNVKTYTYNSAGICLTEHTFYPKTKYESLSKYEYVFY